MTTSALIPVILCGGSGERLRPLSRPEQPKQFLRLFSDYSLLQETALRTMRVSGAASSQIISVTLEAFRGAVLAHYRELDVLPDHHIISEPRARNTAAAIANAALYAHDMFGPDSILWVLPSDHYIGHEENLRADLQKAVAAAEKDFLVTFGIKPSRPDPNYGYIRAGAVVESCQRIEAFTEKPLVQEAANYIKTGRYLWNSGMFVFKTGAVLQAYVEHAPWILSAIQIQNYEAVESVPFDRAIMEKTNKGAVVASDPGWSDIGSWEALWALGVRGRRA